MKRVLTAVVLIPIVLLIVFRAPDPLFTAIIGVVAILALLEFAGLVRGYGYDVDRALLIVLFVLFFAFTALHRMGGGWELGFLVLAAILLMAVATGRLELRQVMPSAAAGVLALLYIACTLLSLVALRDHPWGKFLILYLFVVVWSGDTFAYYTGRSIGKHKLAPSISPGKTWEGTIASIVGSTALGVLMFVFSRTIVGFLLNIHLLQASDSVGPFAAGMGAVWLSPPIWAAVLLSACINVAAQVGDLVESAIKRGAGVKDSGTLLPGHGGILDRIDALLFAAPVALVLIQILLPAPLA